MTQIPERSRPRVARACVTLMLLALVAACAQQRPQPLPADAAPDPADGQGYALLSVTKNAGSNAWVLFRPLGGEERPLDAMGRGFTTHQDDFEGDDEQSGRLMFLPLAPGHYEITNWRLQTHSTKQRDYNLGPAALPPLGFFVRAGEVVYLGNFHIRAERGLADLHESLQPIRSAGIEVTDRSARDLELFRERYTAFAGQPLRMSVKSRSDWDITIEGH